MIEFQINSDSYLPFIFEIDFFFDIEENLYGAISDFMKINQINPDHLIGIIDKGPIHNESNTIILSFSDMDSAKKFIDSYSDDEWMREILYKDSGIMISDYDED